MVDIEKIGWLEGTCSRCGKTIRRKAPIDYAVCDCWQYCPVDHGTGAYSTKMEPYEPDLNPATYGPIETESSTQWGDLEHPAEILYYCPECDYHSSAKPIEVQLS